jgi:O-antigen ligase
MLRALQLGLAFPSILYLTAMAVFLFRPPDIHVFYADRIAFAVLVFFVVLRTLALRQRLPFVASLSLPMLGLTGLAVARVVREPFDAQNWSIIAGKFIVPFTLFHLAVLVFRGASERRHFEIFVILTLAYLVFISVAFLADARSFVLPRFILDESLGFHPDRARGPFLQAVANGVSLNLLGILALVLSNKRTLVVLLWLALPVAVLATMTRAVWISFVVSTLAVTFRLLQHRRQRIWIGLALAGLVAGCLLAVNNASLKKAISERTAERGPVEARVAVYNASWAMFQERPFAGWPAGVMYDELARRMEGYRLHTFYVHNTYLALLVEFGIPGLVLYTVLFANLFRLARKKTGTGPDSLCLLRKVWPIFLTVYLFNACFVDMAYQFVIGLLFTVAGLMCASEEASV